MLVCFIFSAVDCIINVRLVVGGGEEFPQISNKIIVSEIAAVDFGIDTIECALFGLQF